VGWVGSVGLVEVVGREGFAIVMVGAGGGCEIYVVCGCGRWADEPGGRWVVVCWWWDGRSFGAMRKLCRGFVVEGERRSVLYERR
jgi:hypothetical protein